MNKKKLYLITETALLLKPTLIFKDDLRKGQTFKMYRQNPQDFCFRGISVYKTEGGTLFTKSYF